jgi:hypothetical protein
LKLKEKRKGKVKILRKRKEKWERKIGPNSLRAAHPFSPLHPRGSTSVHGADSYGPRVITPKPCAVSLKPGAHLAANHGCSGLTLHCAGNWGPVVSPSAPWTHGTHVTTHSISHNPLTAPATGNLWGRPRSWATIPHGSQPLCGIKPLSIPRPTLPCVLAIPPKPRVMARHRRKEKSFPPSRENIRPAVRRAVLLPVPRVVIRSSLRAVAASSRVQPPHRRSPRVPLLVMLLTGAFRKNTARHQNLRPPYDIDVGSLTPR